MRKKIIDYNKQSKYEIIYRDFAATVFQQYYLLKEFCDNIHSDIEYFQKRYMIEYHKNICVVFSQMCVEAMVNDYITDYIDKKTFEEICDRLTIQNKLMFISKFITNKKIDKSTKLWSSLSSTLKERNDLVHHKPTIYNYDDIHEGIEGTIINVKSITYDWFISEYLKIAKKAVETIIETAKYLQNEKQENYYVDDILMTYYDRDDFDIYREMAVKEFKITLTNF